MTRTLLNAKLHRVTVTDVHLDYEGSCAIDEYLLICADIKEYEMLHIYNINNGMRFSTYAILAKAGSGVVSINGAAARKACKGDKIIICSYGIFDEVSQKNHKPNLIYVDENNKVIHINDKIPKQIA
jgi:aspartate 1-decarboxylase